MKQILIVFCVFGFFSTQVLAGGFQVALQGAKNSGMAQVGTALPLDASATYFNPGSAALLTGFQVNVGVYPVIASIQYQNDFTGLTGAKDFGVGTPFSLYLNGKLSKDETKILSKIGLGLAVYTPFGSTIVYPDDWPGRYVTQNVALSTIFIQPTVSFQVNNRIGIGAGLIYGIGNFAIERAVPLFDAEGEGKARLAGSGNGFGVNAGVYAEVIENKLALGLSYKYAPTVPIEGTAEFDAPISTAALFPNTDFDLSVQLPSMLVLGATYFFNANDDLKRDKSNGSFISFDVNYAQWSVFKELRFVYDQPVAGANELVAERNYHDSFTFRLGGQHTLNEKLTLRGGLNYDQEVANDCCVTPETPDAVRISPSVGATIRPTKNLDIDLAFIWAEGMKRATINEQANFPSTYKSRGWIPCVGVQYAF